MEEAEVKVMVADESHIKYIDTILTTIAEAAKKRGSGIAKRSPEYVATKMREAKAIPEPRFFAASAIVVRMVSMYLM